MSSIIINVIEIGEQKAPVISGSIFSFGLRKCPDPHQAPDSFSTPKQKVYLKSYKMKRGVPHWTFTYTPIYAMEVYAWTSNPEEIIREFVKKRGGQIKRLTVSWTDEP